MKVVDLLHAINAEGGDRPMLEAIFSFLGWDALIPYTGIGGVLTVLILLNEFVLKPLSRPSTHCGSVSF